ncbi:hypothetical protein [Prevotella sp. HMSC073D09]|uniref:hypothetical protein n=1 Tax=Prevotella sp. HMSC073D09 TaxID=1739459 RepID=UPI0011131757|nr:hypothetical protein [Prevotella sp. HMSC073D09]
MAVALNKNSFCLHAQATPFCTKTNLRENRFFALGCRLVDNDGTHNVKILAEKQTKHQVDELAS